MTVTEPFPGIELDEFLDNERSINIRSKPKREDVVKGIQLLKEGGLVKIRKRDGKTRIILIDIIFLTFIKC